MNNKQAMEALIAGKRIQRDDYSEDQWVQLRADGCLIDEDGDLTELSFAGDAEDEWRVYIDKLGNSRGSFMWAVGQHAQGHNIVRTETLGRQFPVMMSVHKPFAEHVFDGRDVAANDWAETP
jgi:hypothetical protein